MKKSSLFLNLGSAAVLVATAACSSNNAAEKADAPATEAAAEAEAAPAAEAAPEAEAAPAAEADKGAEGSCGGN